MSSSKSRAKARKKQSAVTPASPPVAKSPTAQPPVVKPVAAPTVEASKPQRTPFVNTTRPLRVMVPEVKAAPVAAPVRVAPVVETKIEEREEVLPVAPPSDRFWMASMGIMVLAIILRQVQLGQAPFHPDESIHAFFSYGFGGYHYDPVYHGPLLYHLVALFFRVFGQYDYVARLVPSLLGIGLVAMILGPARRWMGNRAALAAAGMVAVSPSIVTYSRHLLHDALALDLTLGAVLCFITALHHPADDKRGRSALLGLAACLTLFLATKANFFFILVVIVAFYGSWLVTGTARFSLAYSRAWPAALFALVTFASIFWPRDNTFSEPDKAVQHRIFQIIAVGCCAAFLFWTSGRPQDELERQGRARWKVGNDWGTWVLGLALALWIYWFLYGQIAQVLAQWATNHSFPWETWKSGLDSAQHAIQKMLDYWGGQQAKPRLPSRHDYYIVLGILYELPIYLVAIGGIWHATKKRTVFSDFLLWWAFASWTVYAVANEKVPWLLVHIILPLALLGALWIASLNWRKPLFFAATCAGLLFALRGDVAMIFERAGDNAEPLLYAQAPDNFRDAVTSALEKTRGDGRDIWMGNERQWPSVWYLRDTKWNPIRGTSGTPIGTKEGFTQPEKARVFVAQESDLVNWKNREDWDLKTVNFLVWPRASWTALEPARFWRWFVTRQTIAPEEEEPGPGKSATSILSGKGEWSHATAIIGARKETATP